jgi:DHA1 family inner membrane transport protein
MMTPLNKSQSIHTHGDPTKLGSQIFAATLARFMLNTARRFAYPFAPALSRGLGVPMAAITSLIAVNQVTALIGVIFGPLTDRWGYRRMMLAGMGLMVLGMWIGGFFATYLAVFLAMLLAGLGKSVFDPSIQAYVGKQVPYQRRARAVGMVEISWAGSSLIGIPLVGIMMQWAGWVSAFWIIGGLGILCLIGLYFVLPSDNGYSASAVSILTMFHSWRSLVRNRPALCAIGFSFFISLANDTLFVVFGAWMESAFGLGLASLGFATAIIGVAELLGEGLTVMLSDRIGLRRAAIIGATLTTVTYLLLILMGQTLTMALTALFMLFLSFEFTVVTILSLCTELHPSARATMMAGLYAVGALGRVIGALSGGILWTFFGWNTVCLFSAAINVIGVILLAWGLRNWKRT